MQPNFSLLQQLLFDSFCFEEYVQGNCLDSISVKGRPDHNEVSNFARVRHPAVPKLTKSDCRALRRHLLPYPFHLLNHRHLEWDTQSVTALAWRVLCDGIDELDKHLNSKATPYILISYKSGRTVLEYNRNVWDSPIRERSELLACVSGWLDGESSSEALSTQIGLNVSLFHWKIHKGELADVGKNLISALNCVENWLEPGLDQVPPLSKTMNPDNSLPV